MGGAAAHAAGPPRPRSERGRHRASAIPAPVPPQGHQARATPRHGSGACPPDPGRRGQGTRSPIRGPRPRASGRFGHASTGGLARPGLGGRGLGRPPPGPCRACPGGTAGRSKRRSRWSVSDEGTTLVVGPPGPSEGPSEEERSERSERSDAPYEGGVLWASRSTPAEHGT